MNGVIQLKTEHKEKYKKLGLKISYYRKLKGFTQEQLADRLSMNATFIGQVEAPNMNKAISMDTLFDISDILGVPAHKFLNFEDD